MVRRDETFEPEARPRGIFKLTEDLLQGQAYSLLSGQREPVRSNKRHGHPASISLFVLKSPTKQRRSVRLLS